MENFIVTIQDISNINKPKILDHGILISADGKPDAIDKAHILAEKKYPNTKRLVEVRRT